MAPISGLTVDIYTPSLPIITEHMHTSPDLARLTVSVLLLSYGAFNLLFGTLSDSVGRPPANSICQPALRGGELNGSLRIQHCNLNYYSNSTRHRQCAVRHRFYCWLRTDCHGGQLGAHEKCAPSILIVFFANASLCASHLTGFILL